MRAHTPPHYTHTHTHAPDRPPACPPTHMLTCMHKRMSARAHTCHDIPCLPAMPHHAALYRAAPHHVVLSHTVPCYATPCYSTPLHATPHHSTPRTDVCTHAHKSARAHTHTLAHASKHIGACVCLCACVHVRARTCALKHTATSTGMLCSFLKTADSCEERASGRVK